MRLDALPGNEALKRQLSAQAARRGLSHAYLISGPAGSGKATLARLLAAAMVCTGGEALPCGHCPGCKKALAGIHPDILTLGAEGREITVAQARQMRADAYIRPNEAPRKVYIIQNAQNMNPGAQNAILKLLEEGPAYAAFLLLTPNPGALLPTVRSRCEVLTLAPGGEPAAPAGGSAAEDARELLERFAAGSELALAQFCVGLEKRDREELGALLDHTIDLLRHALALQAGAGGVPPELAPAAARAARLPKKALVDAAAGLERLRRSLEFNVGAGHLCGALCAVLARAGA